MSSNNKKISRREFMRLSAIGSFVLWMGSAGCMGRVKAARQGMGNRFVRAGKPLLVVVEGTDHEGMLRAGLEALGGLPQLVRGGTSVLIKPNFVFRQQYPVTTDPEMIFLMTRLLREAGAGVVEVFDAPGTYLIGSERETFDFNDVINKGKEHGVPVTYGDAGRRREYVATRKEGWQSYDEILIHNKVYQAPVVINMPCLKRHHTSYLTCALKNHFGAVYGAQRWDAHIRGEGLDKMSGSAKKRATAEFRDETHFMTALAEFADAVRPELSFVDARSILTKGGPTKNKGKIKKGINKFILSGDMVALDAYCSRLMEENDDTYTTQMIEPYLRVAARLGLGTPNLQQVEIIEIKV